VIPSAWLLAAGLIGTRLRGDYAGLMTAALWLTLLFGMPGTMYWLARRLPGQTLRIRRTTTAGPWRSRSVRSSAATARRPAIKLDARTHTASVALLALVAVLTIFTWVGVPLVWLWTFSQLLDSTTPTMWPYVAMTVTIPASMFGVAALIARIADARERMLGGAQAAPRAKWLRSLRDARPTAGDTGAADVVVIVAVVASLVALLVWVFVLADPGQMLPQELRGAG
jgi:hypothetical protein